MDGPRVLLDEPEVQLWQGDCLDVLVTRPENSVDSCVTDPPGGLSFMGKTWDHDRGGRTQWCDWMSERAAEVLRVLKPGGYAVVWAFPQTTHWTACAWEDSGFDIVGRISHIYGSGFPKSLNISKAIDAQAGATREVVGSQRLSGNACVPTKEKGGTYGVCVGTAPAQDVAITAPATPEAEQWDGWGTALKPALEDWWLFRKPFSERTYAENVLRWGTGALNIAGARLPRIAGDVPGWHQTGSRGRTGYLGTDTFRVRDISPEEVRERCSGGRWPANLVLSHAEGCKLIGTRNVKSAQGEHTIVRRTVSPCLNNTGLNTIGSKKTVFHYGDCDGHETVEDWECVENCPVLEMDRQSGCKTPSGSIQGTEPSLPTSGIYGNRQRVPFQAHLDGGGASRFFHCFRYAPKPSRGERDAGCKDIPDRTRNRVNAGGLENDPKWNPGTARNIHPCVKARTLMDFLVRLVTPPKGIVLDAFAGSGSTGVASIHAGFRFVGIEADTLDGYGEIAVARIREALWFARQPTLFEDDEEVQ